jgi:hypothetical protein
LLAVARGLSTRHPREGMILGATVGAGFAAFESSGYALKAFIENIDEHAVLNIVGTEAVRADGARHDGIEQRVDRLGGPGADRRVERLEGGISLGHVR